MATMQIPCPECGSVLKLPDRSLLGKTGRCPSCRHTFVLTEPEEVQLQLADGPVDDSLRQGTSARWVPDETVAATDNSTGEDPPASQTDVTPQVGAAGFPVLEDPDTPVRSRSKQRKKREKKTAPPKGQRRKRGPSLAVVVGSAIVVLAVAGVAVTWLRPGPDTQAPAADTATDPAAIPGANQSTAKQAGANPGDRTADSGVSGQPSRAIRLEMVPAGVSVVINIRPEVFWTEESYGEELRFCLGPLGEWAGEQLKSLCRFPPEEIEEAKICLMLLQQDEPPEVAVVVRLKEAQKPSVLLEKFPGQRSDDYSYPVYLDETHCYLRSADAKTVAIGPRDRAEEMAASVRQPAVTSRGIEEILSLTNRDKLVTVVFEPRDMRIFDEVLVPKAVVPMFNLMLDWFNDEEIATVAWSIDIDQQRDEFESEILLRNHNSANSIVTPGRLERSVQKRLGMLPVELMRAVEKMQPGQVGAYRLISRFPALMSAYVLETDTAVGDRHVQLLTRLPERAAPNIALAALLTWDESTRTDFSVAAPKRVDQGKKLPATVAGRLGVKIDVDFRRTPLQDAVDFIGEEIQVPFDIDGDALKLSGFTKNMAQTLTRGDTAKAVLHEIMKQYKGMVIVVDESKKRIMLTTQPVAEKKGLKPFPVAN